MTLENIMEWVRTLPPQADNYYCGTLDVKRDRSIGVYPSKHGRARVVGVGNCVTTRERDITLLVHWTQSTRETETAAYVLYNALCDAQNVTVGGGTPVNYVALPYNAPVAVGADSHGVQEYVIDITLFYQEG